MRYCSDELRVEWQISFFWKSTIERETKKIESITYLIILRDFFLLTQDKSTLNQIFSTSGSNSSESWIYYIMESVWRRNSSEQYQKSCFYTSSIKWNEQPNLISPSNSTQMLMGFYFAQTRKLMTITKVNHSLNNLQFWGFPAFINWVSVLPP